MPEQGLARVSASLRGRRTRLYRARYTQVVLLKSAMREELLRAVRTVHSGGRYPDPAVASW